MDRKEIFANVRNKNDTVHKDCGCNSPYHFDHYIRRFRLSGQDQYYALLHAIALRRSRNEL